MHVPSTHTMSQFKSINFFGDLELSMNFQHAQRKALIHKAPRWDVHFTTLRGGSRATCVNDVSTDWAILSVRARLGATWHGRVCRCLKPDFHLRATKGVNDIQINWSSARCKQQGKSVTSPAHFRPSALELLLETLWPFSRDLLGLFLSFCMTDAIAP